MPYDTDSRQPPPWAPAGTTRHCTDLIAGLAHLCKVLSKSSEAPPQTGEECKKSPPRVQRRPPQRSQHRCLRSDARIYPGCMAAYCHAQIRLRTAAYPKSTHPLLHLAPCGVLLCNHYKGASGRLGNKSNVPR